MRIFVAGATGVIGRRVVRRLASAGHAVAGLSRSENNREWLGANGAEPREGNLFDRDTVLRITSDAEAIVHLATAIPAGERTGKNDWRMNDRLRTEGTGNLLAAAVANRCRIYVQESVTFLYGDRSGEWTDETVPAADDLPSMLRSAVGMEEMVRRADAGSAVSATILRFGALYAHDAAHTASMFSMIRKGRMPLVGGGRAYWCPVHADDAADAVVKALGNIGTTGGKTYNICDDEPVMSRDLVGYIAGILGGPKPRNIPAVFARFLTSRDEVKFFTASVRCRNDAAKRDLGWRPAHPAYREGFSAEIALWLGGKGWKM